MGVGVLWKESEMPVLLLLPLLIFGGIVAFGAAVFSLLTGGHESHADVVLIFLVFFGLVTTLYFGRHKKDERVAMKGNSAFAIGMMASGFVLALIVIAPTIVLFLGNAVMIACAAAILMLLTEWLMFSVVG